MRTLLILLLLCFTARAQVLITATVTVTNSTGTTNGQTIAMNGDTRRWTNSVFIPATQIRTNNTINGAAANLLNHLAVHAFSGLHLGLAGTTGVTLRSNAAFTVTLSPGWASLAYVTNSSDEGQVFRVPFTLESAPRQTNAASGVAIALESSANTNRGILPVGVLEAVGGGTNEFGKTIFDDATNAAGFLYQPSGGVVTNKTISLTGDAVGTSSGASISTVVSNLPESHVSGLVADLAAKQPAVILSNVFPSIIFTGGYLSASVPWQSNWTLYMITTNAAGATAYTNKIGGL